jgi:hypothetical protein
MSTGHYPVVSTPGLVIEIAGLYAIALNIYPQNIYLLAQPAKYGRDEMYGRGSLH